MTARSLIASRKGVIFYVFQESVSKQEASAEHQSHTTGWGSVTRAPRSPSSCVRSEKSKKINNKITSVLQASSLTNEPQTGCAIFIYLPCLEEGH